LVRATIGLAFFPFHPHYPHYPPYGQPNHLHLAIILVFLVGVFSLFAYRRRRIAWANLALDLAFIQQTQQGSGAGYGSPGPPFAPRYSLLSLAFVTLIFLEPFVSPQQYYPPGRPYGRPSIASYLEVKCHRTVLRDVKTFFKFVYNITVPRRSSNITATVR
jgi:hypothetical protein